MKFPAERIAARGGDAELALREWLTSAADNWAEKQFERLRTHLLKAAMKEGYTLPPDNKHVREVAAAKLYRRLDGHG